MGNDFTRKFKIHPFPQVKAMLKFCRKYDNEKQIPVDVERKQDNFDTYNL